jgi:hypothetical protein
VQIEIIIYIGAMIEAITRNDSKVIFSELVIDTMYINFKEPGLLDNGASTNLGQI